MDAHTLLRLFQPFQFKVIKDGSTLFVPFYCKNPSFKVDEDKKNYNWNEYSMMFPLFANNLEDIFYWMQGPLWSPDGEGRELIRMFRLQHTSMSIGDIIRDCSKKSYFIVCANGFKEVNLNLS